MGKGERVVGGGGGGNGRGSVNITHNLVIQIMAMGLKYCSHFINNNNFDFYKGFQRLLLLPHFHIFGVRPNSTKLLLSYFLHDTPPLPSIPNQLSPRSRHSQLTSHNIPISAEVSLFSPDLTPSTHLLSLPFSLPQSARGAESTSVSSLPIPLSSSSSDRSPPSVHPSFFQPLSSLPLSS